MMPPGEAIGRRAVTAWGAGRRSVIIARVALIAGAIAWISVGIVRWPRARVHRSAAPAVVLDELPEIAELPETGEPFDPPIAPPGEPLVEIGVLGGLSPEVAIERADALAALAPDDPPRALGRALAHLAAGEDTTLLDQVVRDHPRYAAAWSSKAYVELRRGRYDAAEAAFARALSLDPRDAIGWRNRGILRHRLGHVRLAYLDLRQAIALAPDDLQALAELVQLYTRAGHVASSRALLERLVALDPTSERYRRDLCALTGCED